MRKKNYVICMCVCLYVYLYMYMYVFIRKTHTPHLTVSYIPKFIIYCKYTKKSTHYPIQGQTETRDGYISPLLTHSHKISIYVHIM